MTILQAALLGLVQGIAEFLPISSSGHLSVLQNLFGMSDIEGGHIFFDVLLHLGTLTSICYCYWNDIKAMVTELLEIAAGGKNGREKAGSLPAARLFLMLVLGTLPLFLVLPVNDYVEQLYYKTVFIGAAFILTGCMLFVADKMMPGRKNARTMRASDALIIGVCQAVATIPGLSRSGTTITAGMAVGLDRRFAVKYSFLLSLPAVLGANLLSFVKALGQGIDFSLMPAYIVGMFTAMVSGVVAIRLVHRITSKGKFGMFAYYCWVAGALTIILSLVF